MKMKKSEPAMIQAQVTVSASLSDTWEAWTTEAGAKTFFAPDCHIELRPGGSYEIYFNPNAEPGSRGGEGMILLAVQPEQMLSFTWNAPPHLPEAREQMTHVTINLLERDADLTEVSLSHDGWGTGGEWDEAFKYFDEAWKSVVLPRLAYRFDHGPVDWESPPDPSTLEKFIPK
jgi:uncharacterized protein YndB with AHSA1/START domain